MKAILIASLALLLAAPAFADDHTQQEDNGGMPPGALGLPIPDGPVGVVAPHPQGLPFPQGRVVPKGKPSTPPEAVGLPIQPGDDGDDNDNDEHHGPPPGAQGLPFPQGRVVPPGGFPHPIGLVTPPAGGRPPMGMPARDAACRRAAAATAQKAALDAINHSEDCTVNEIITKEFNSLYQVKVNCPHTGDFDYLVKTKGAANDAGCKAGKAKLLKS